MPKFLLVAASLFALAACTSMQNSSSSSSSSKSPQESNAAADPRLDWWRDARFGMFIHWGLYSIPAGKWGDETNHAEWIRTTAKIPVQEYEKLTQQFNPVNFNADQWVSLAKDAGCKYIVITTKHHDGFCLFDSKYTEFDVMHTPFRRDIMRELSDACHRQGIVQCWYHSIMDWHHPDYLPRRDWEKKDRPEDGADFDRYNMYLKNQVAELLNNYGKIGVLWFDGEWEDTWTPARGEDLYAWCRHVQPTVIINNRVGKARDGTAGLNKPGSHAVGDFGTPEQEIPATGLPGVDWETCMTMNDHWGYNAADKNFKSSEELIHNLCDIASKGGNFLLNVGPTSKGEIPPESVQRLHDIGRWMKVNGDAIYGTQASPLADLDFGRCTLKWRDAQGRELAERESGSATGATLYLHVFDWPKSGQIRIEGLASNPTGAHLLADSGRAVKTSRDGSALVVALAGSAPDPICSVVALEIAGKPVVYAAPEITAGADQFIRPVQVSLSTPADKEAAVRYTTDGSEPNPASNVYNRPFIRVTDTTTIKARTFKNGEPVSGTRSMTLTKVDPAPAIALAKPSAGLVRTTYKGDWDKLPDFGAMTPTATDTVPKIKLASSTDEHVGHRFAGYINIARDDVYLFKLSSDDGARLLIDGKTVIDLDGTHGTIDKTAPAPLAKGWHAVTLDWFNKTGDVTLSLKFAPAGEELKAIPPEALGH